MTVAPKNYINLLIIFRPWAFDTVCPASRFRQVIGAEICTMGYQKTWLVCLCRPHLRHIFWRKQTKVINCDCLGWKSICCISGNITICIYHAKYCHVYLLDKRSMYILTLSMCHCRMSLLLAWIQVQEGFSGIVFWMSYEVVDPLF